MFMIFQHGTPWMYQGKPQAFDDQLEANYFLDRITGVKHMGFRMGDVIGLLTEEELRDHATPEFSIKEI